MSIGTKFEYSISHHQLHWITQNEKDPYESYKTS